MTKKVSLCSISKIMSTWEEERQNAFLIRTFQAKSSNMQFQGSPEITSQARLPMLLTYTARPDVPKPTLVSPFIPLTNAY